MKRIVIVAVIALFVVITVSKGSGQTPGTKVYKMGLALPLTGANAEVGLRLSRVGDMIVDDINKAGGVKVGKDTYTFKAYYEDMKLTTEGGVSAAKKLILDDKVDFISPWGTVAFLAAESVSVPAKVIQMGLGTPENCIGPNYPHVFRVYSTGNQMIPAAVVWLAENYPQYKTWKYVNMHSPQEEEGAILTKNIGENFGKKMFKPLFYDISMQDYSPVVAAVMVDNPEAIIMLFVGYPGAGLFIKGLREAGWKGQLLAHSVPTPAAIEIAGKKNVEGMFCVGLDQNSELAPRGLRDWSRRYAEKYPPDTFTIMAGELVAEIQIMAQALPKAGSIDSDKVKAVLESGVTFNTLFGPINFGLAEVYGVPHQAIHPQFITKIVDGKEKGVVLISAEQTTKNYLKWRIK